MIIKLEQSLIFTRPPHERFALKTGHDIWQELWKRHKLLGYNTQELCELYRLKTGTNTTPQSIKRWVWKTEVYSMVQPVMQEGVRVVQSEFFREYESRVIKELMKNLKSSVNKEPRILL